MKLSRGIKLHLSKRVKPDKILLEKGLPTLSIGIPCSNKESLKTQRVNIMNYLSLRFEYGMTRKEVDLDFKNRRKSFRWKKHLHLPRLRSLYQGNDFKERAKRNRCRESERRKKSHCPRNLYRIRYSFDILLREASSISLKITGIRATLESNDNEPRSSFLCVIE